MLHNHYIIEWQLDLIQAVEIYLKLLHAPGQFEPTFNNPGAWSSIRDRKTAIAAAGSATKVDMAAKSISNSTLQKQAAKFCWWKN